MYGSPLGNKFTRVVMSFNKKLDFLSSTASPVTFAMYKLQSSAQNTNLNIRINKGISGVHFAHLSPRLWRGGGHNKASIIEGVSPG